MSAGARRRAVALALGAAAATVAVTVAPAHAAKKPPPPSGVPIVSAGQLPRPCAAGDERYGATGYSSVMGAYYDAKLNAWASAPYCYPVWGNLAATGSQIVNPGQAATIAATPNGGSNSATYAPQTKSITWSYGGTRRAGCGNADLTCTIVAARRGTGSWQWVEVRVSMPRTFFINSPGEFCAGQPICAGVATNAWAYVGVRPSAVRPGFIRGRVVDPDGDPVEDVRVAASGPDSGAATTNGAGRYVIQVDRAGTYRVSATSDDAVFSPRQRSVSVPKGGTGTADFALTGCKAKLAGAAGLLGARAFSPPAWAAENPCRKTVIRGKVQTRAGEGVAGVRVTASGKAERSGETGRDGKFAIKVPEGTYRLRAAKFSADRRLPPVLREREYAPTSRTVAAKAGKPADGGRFEEVPLVTGLVLSAEKRPIKGADVAIAPAGGGAAVSVRTDADGFYAAKVKPGSYVVTPSFGGDSAPFVPRPGPSCAAAGASCRVKVERDTKVNFGSKCESKVDFKSSMIAVNGCFRRVAPEKWEASGDFRINGIDFSATDRKQPTVFDAKARTVTGRKLRVWLTNPQDESRWLAYDIGSFSKRFPGTSVRYTMTLGDPTPSLKGLLKYNLAATVFGMPAHAPALELESTAGRTTVSLQLSGPPRDGAFVDPITGLWKARNAQGQARIAYPNAFRAAIALTNGAGIQSVEGSFAPSKIYGYYRSGPSAGKVASPQFPAAGFVQIARIGIKYDLAFDIWRLSGTVVFHNPGATTQLPEGGPGRTLFQSPDGEAFLAAKILELELGLKFSDLKKEGVFSLVQRLRLSANGLNWLFAPQWQLYVQRLGFDAGRDTDLPSAPQKLQLNLGMTWLPRLRSDLWFQEAASLDLTAGVFVDTDTSFVGTMDLRVVGARVMNGRLTWFQSSGDIDATGRITLNPREVLRAAIDAGFDGQGRLSFPYKRPWSMTGRGSATLFGKSLRAELLWRSDVLALCFGKESRWGYVHTGRTRLGGCDISEFGPVALHRGSATGTARGAAAARDLTLRASRVRGLRIRGAGGPPRVRIEGPRGLRLEIPAGEQALITEERSVIPNADDGSTYVFIRNAPAGRYRIVPLADAPAITGVQAAGALPAPRVRTSVARRGCARTLRWSLTPRRGQRVRFVERGGAGERTITVTSAARGSVRFAPNRGVRAVRTVVAVVEQGGAPRTALRVARFRADGAGRPARVRGLRVSRASARVRARWAPVCGATAYAVTAARGREAIQWTIRGTRATLTAPRGKGRITVTVAAIGDRLTGPAARAAR